jgi:hypothetical protein
MAPRHVSGSSRRMANKRLIPRAGADEAETKKGAPAKARVPRAAQGGELAGALSARPRPAPICSRGGGASDLTGGPGLIFGTYGQGLLAIYCEA